MVPVVLPRPRYCSAAPDTADTASDTSLDTGHPTLRLFSGHREDVCVCSLHTTNNPWLIIAGTLGFFDLSEGRVRKITELGQVNFLNYLQTIQEAPPALMST